MLRARLSALAALVLAVSAGAAAADVVRDAALKQEMKQIVEPASNTLFSVGGDVDPANGPDAAKTPAARWLEGATAAGKLKLEGQALVAGKYGKPEGTWMAEAQKMAALSAAAETAARAHDGAALSKAANDLSDVCSACHGKYKAQD